MTGDEQFHRMEDIYFFFCFQMAVIVSTIDIPMSRYLYNLIRWKSYTC